jgi:hypothetical protein
VETSGLNLLIPEKADPERDAVAAAWENAGGDVFRVARFWEPPELPLASIRVYGNETFCLVLQEKLGLELATPDDELILAAPSRLLRRVVTKSALADAAKLAFPLFVKTLVPKLIPSRIYESASELSAVADGLALSTELLVSEAVKFAAEVRAFVLRREVLDLAAYEGAASLADARAFVDGLVQNVAVPVAVVVDVGRLADGTWALVEFNAAWGAGLNGCDAERVLPAIARASEPAGYAGPALRSGPSRLGH